MKNIDIAKAKAHKENRGKLEGRIILESPDHLKQVESIKEVRDELVALSELINSKEEYDYDKLAGLLNEISEKLDLEPLFLSLAKSIKESVTQTTASTKASIKEKQDGFAKLTSVLNDIKALQAHLSQKANDPFADYKASDVSLGDAMSYYGFLHPSGRWYIMRQTGVTDALFRYAVGSSNYQDAWQRKEVQRYKHYNEIVV